MVAPFTAPITGYEGDNGDNSPNFSFVYQLSNGNKGLFIASNVRFLCTSLLRRDRRLIVPGQIRQVRHSLVLGGLLDNTGRPLLARFTLANKWVFPTPRRAITRVNVNFHRFKRQQLVKGPAKARRRRTFVRDTNRASGNFARRTNALRAKRQHNSAISRRERG